MEIESRTCKFYVQHKKRFCRMLVARGNNFCGQHLVNENNQIDGARIPCPLDSKHSCFKNKLEEHLARCNARKKPEGPFYVPDINNDRANDLPRIALKDLTDEHLNLFIKKVEAIHAAYVAIINAEIKSHPIFEESLKNPSYGNFVLRHLEQNASLMGILKEKGLLDSSLPTTFVEFGAGRGKLSGWLMEASKDPSNSTFILVDKGAQRYKIDSRLKHRNLYKIRRVRIDIKDFDLSKMEDMEINATVVGTGKHLCGAATDYALRCLTKVSNSKVGGVLIALCCHHRCSWSSYSGKEFLQSVGLSSEDFMKLVTLTSWAVSSERKEKNTKDKDSSEESHVPKDAVETEGCQTRYEKLNLTTEIREKIGRKAKQILDFGRVLYLKEKGYDASLIRYVSQTSTLENIAIFGMPNLH